MFQNAENNIVLNQPTGEMKVKIRNKLDKTLNILGNHNCAIFRCFSHHIQLRPILQGLRQVHLGDHLRPR